MKERLGRLNQHFGAARKAYDAAVGPDRWGGVTEVLSASEYGKEPSKRFFHVLPAGERSPNLEMYDILCCVALTGWRRNIPRAGHD